MRLIDADKLIKDIKQLWDYKTVDGITATTVLKQTITDIENQPTVEAIPIEWIENQIKRTTDITDEKELDLIYAGNLGYMLKLWEKENESRDTESTK